MQQHSDWLDAVTVGKLSAGQQLIKPNIEDCRNKAETDPA